MLSEISVQSHSFELAEQQKATTIKELTFHTLVFTFMRYTKGAIIACIFLNCIAHQAFLN